MLQIIIMVKLFVKKLYYNSIMNESSLKQLLIDKWHKPLNDKTATKYVYDLYALHNRIFKNKNITSLDFLYDKEKIMKGAEYKNDTDKYSYLTFRNNLNNVVVWLRVNGDDEEADKYVELRDSFNDKYNDDNATGKFLNQNQKDKMLSFNNWDNIIKTLSDKKDRNTCEDTLLLVMTIHRAYPLRNDLGDMEITTQAKYNKLTETEKDDRNRIIKNQKGMKFILTKYKTAGTYHRKEIPITNDKVKKFLSTWFRNHKTNKYLIQNKFGQPLGNSALAVLMNNTSAQYNNGNTIGSTSMRKSYLTNTFAGAKSEMNAMSNIMCHSVGTALHLYVKENGEVI